MFLLKQLQHNKSDHESRLCFIQATKNFGHVIIKLFNLLTLSDIFIKGVPGVRVNMYDVATRWSRFC